MRLTGGRWDRAKKNCYFIASNTGHLEQGSAAHDHLLCAVNEIRSDEDRRRLHQWCDTGKTVFIDSGVFSLTNDHMRAHPGMTMDQVLALAPAELDGFAKLFTDYCTIIRELGERVWGYIEIDQGGRENKIKTRARLEALGFSPIPVYHPLVDGWEYFDYLAERYDRICFGNVVQADRDTRKRLLATAWERRRKYPHLWIHLLGLTANEMCNAYPVDSCDSSTWLSLVRWPDAFKARTACQSFSAVPGVAYDRSSDPYSETGHHKAARLGAYEAAMNMRNWRAVCAEYREHVASPDGYEGAQ